MPLTDSEKAERARQRMLASARKYTTGTYKTKHVAPVFQKMIRAEAGAVTDNATPAVISGAIRYVSRPIGWCACVTCGKVLPWSGGKGRFGGLHCGHFIASRTNSVIFNESNCAPQCAGCNVFKDGNPTAFRQWMEFVRPGEAEVLWNLKNKVFRTFTLGGLVDLKIEYASRLRVAVERMGE